MELRIADPEEFVSFKKVDLPSSCSNKRYNVTMIDVKKCLSSAESQMEQRPTWLREQDWSPRFDDRDPVRDLREIWERLMYSGWQFGQAFSERHAGLCEERAEDMEPNEELLKFLLRLKEGD